MFIYFPGGVCQPSYSRIGKSIDKTSTIISRKFYGDDALVDRCIVTLLGNRGLLLVGEPGTAKSMLSELLAAAFRESDARHAMSRQDCDVESESRRSRTYEAGPGPGPTQPDL